MRRSDIAIVVENFNSQGGVERRTTELVKALLAAGHSIHVYSNRCNPSSAPGARFHHIPTIRIGRAVKPLSFAWFCAALVSGKHDIVHTQARIFRYDVATMGVGCHRAYLDAMGINPDTARDRHFHRAVLHIEQAMFMPGHYRQIITNSRMCREELAEYYSVPLEKISVIHNGVDHEAFSPTVRANLREDIRRELGFAPDDVVVLFLGTGFQRKGLDTLIEALGKLQNRSPVRLLVVGGGDRGRQTTMAFDCGIGERLTWVGRSDSAEVARHYAAADIFALPTRYDPFANSTMEALACGIPVVTTRTNGVSEILRNREDALIVEPNDPQTLAELLDTLLQDEALRQKLGSSGQKAVEPYTWERTSRETIHAYEVALHGGTG